MPESKLLVVSSNLLPPLDSTYICPLSTVQHILVDADLNIIPVVCSQVLALCSLATKNPLQMFQQRQHQPQLCKASASSHDSAVRLASYFATPVRSVGLPVADDDDDEGDEDDEEDEEDEEEDEDDEGEEAYDEDGSEPYTGPQMVLALSLSSAVLLIPCQFCSVTFVMSLQFLLACLCILSSTKAARCEVFEHLLLHLISPPANAVCNLMMGA